MADLTRADELVRTVDRDPGFRAALEAGPTAAAKRRVLDEHGFQDIDLDDMRAYVESKGGTLVVKDGGVELSDQELMAVAGGAEAGGSPGMLEQAGVVDVYVSVEAASAAAF